MQLSCSHNIFSILDLFIQKKKTNFIYLFWKIINMKSMTIWRLKPSNQIWFWYAIIIDHFLFLGGIISYWSLISKFEKYLWNFQRIYMHLWKRAKDATNLEFPWNTSTLSTWNFWIWAMNFNNHLIPKTFSYTVYGV